MENKMVPHTLKVKTIEKYHKYYCYYIFFLFKGPCCYNQQSVTYQNMYLTDTHYYDYLHRAKRLK